MQNIIETLLLIKFIDKSLRQVAHIVISLVIVGCLCLCAFTTFFQSGKYSEKAAAKVIDSECNKITSTDKDGKTYTYDDCEVQLSFKTKSGEKIQTRLSVGSKGRKKGDIINIRYEPRNPTSPVSEDESKFVRQSSYICFGLASFIMLLILPLD